MSSLSARKARTWANSDRIWFYAAIRKPVPDEQYERGTWELTTLHRVHAVRVCATVVLELLPASLTPSFLRLVRPAMP
jgi:hypothetical protein